MYCENCGSFIPNGADHCTSCGRKVTEDINPAFSGKKEGFSKSEDISSSQSKTPPETPPTPQAEGYEQSYDDIFHYDRNDNAVGESSSNSNQDDDKVKRYAIASIILAFIFPLLGLCFGIAGYRKAKDGEDGYKWLCLASIILSAILIFIP